MSRTIPLNKFDNTDSHNTFDNTTSLAQWTKLSIRVMCGRCVPALVHKNMSLLDNEPINIHQYKLWGTSNVCMKHYLKYNKNTHNGKIIKICFLTSNSGLLKQVCLTFCPKVIYLSSVGQKDKCHKIILNTPTHTRMYYGESISI